MHDLVAQLDQVAHSKVRHVMPVDLAVWQPLLNAAVDVHVVLVLPEGTKNVPGELVVISDVDVLVLKSDLGFVSSHV